ncbi:MAG: DUF1071 domain-containing protein [Prochloraceae cyanobacterium]|nr:DUF1071 domain-containing protein [Prochloraceae cyanobacterium]
MTNTVINGNNNNQSIEKNSQPSEPGEWTLAQIQTALKRKLPDSLLKELPGKFKAKYIAWHTAVEILDKYCIGWQWEIKSVTYTTDRIILVGKLSIPTKHGLVIREATGSELLKKTSQDYNTGEIKEEEIPYGDPASNAESMAFRRAASKYGLALYLYKK